MTEADMTTDLPAGRDLDALIAHVLALPLEPPCGYCHYTDDAQRDNGGWSGWCYTCNKSIDEVAPEPRRYSTDIAAAWEVVERMVALGYPTVTVTASAAHNGCIAVIWRNDGDPAFQQGRYLEVSMDSGVSAPLAICRVALRAMEIQNDR